ncbi:deoxyribodipyrimidine photo-lyase [Phaeovulum sp.]|uniref:cryptochrome/photolyase family protein n=1 Tax=Phaeovulum sp. TaxID=2934796 RepID=UPI0035617D63
MSGAPPVLVWFRRDLRLTDNPALAAAARQGRPIICLFVLDPETEAMGAAARWRLGQGLAVLAAQLQARGQCLILRRGDALTVLRAVLAETGATGLHWGRLYTPAEMARDRQIKAALRAEGVAVESHAGALLAEPWQVQTGAGGPYRVYTPFWRAIMAREVAAPLAAPAALPAPPNLPQSDSLAAWCLEAGVARGGDVLARHASVGEQAAADRLADFLRDGLARYDAARDFPAQDGTSGLSAYLALGEIGVRQVWHRVLRALHEGAPGAEPFLRQLVWREFAAHLMYHFPDLDRRAWRPDWDGFPWRGDNDDAEAWRRGETGEPLVDAAMRELYATGHMHNRARMVVASYLTKHLLTDWRVGLAWFADCLVDWDAASNAMGWQWVAGCGPDAAPYFRIFNPATQAAKFDPEGLYRRFWLEPGQPGAEAFHAAAPRSWQTGARAPRPQPVVGLAEGRARALAALERFKRG